MKLDLSLLGWVHTAGCLCALALGAKVLIGQKGTSWHRLFGHLYLASMLVINLTALGIYRRGMFYFPHWFAVAALAAITVGFLCARFRYPARYWVHLHLTSMVTSYYILIGGGVNEVFLRINWLHAIAPDVPGSPAVSFAHAAVFMAFVMLVAYFNFRLLSRRPQRRPARGAPPQFVGAKNARGAIN